LAAPSSPEFCPLVFRTEKLFIAVALPQQAKDIVVNVRKDVLARAAAFLLLKDSKSSYVIEDRHHRFVFRQDYDSARAR
jgi:hypothetical protein